MPRLSVLNVFAYLWNTKQQRYEFSLNVYRISVIKITGKLAQVDSIIYSIANFREIVFDSNVSV